MKEFYVKKRTAVAPCSDGEVPKYLAEAFIQSDLHPFIHTDGVVNHARLGLSVIVRVTSNLS